MTPVFYIGEVSGEIHVKSDDGNFTIKVNKSRRPYGSTGRHIESFDGNIDSLTINNVDCTERYKGHTITYPLLCMIYKEATGKKLKYRSIMSARNNMVRVQEIIETMAPSLRVDFAEKLKVAHTPLSIDEQIFNAWMKNV